MKKRLISLILTAVTLISVLCPMVHADDSTDFGSCIHDWQTPIVHGYSITIPNSDVSFGVEFQQCSKCHWYKHDASLFIVSATYYSPLAPDLNGIVPKELITYWCNKYYEVFGKNATAKEYQPGGGSAEGSSGVGRRPSGYVDDTGTPSFNVDGNLIFYAPITGWGMDSSARAYDIDYPHLHNSYNDGQHVTGTFPLRSGVTSTRYFTAIAYFTAPISGKYYLYNGDVVGLVKSPDFASYKAVVSWSSSSYVRLSKGDKKVAYCSCGFLDRKNSDSTYEAIGYGFHLIVVPDEIAVNKQTNITINNNTWNGNIYVDNSTNLTYIYPQYTTINENNETVTNISNNPIIYNNTTNEYYTYDSVTNNYYYITYVTETPTPTPEPDPTPSPSPSPEPDPTSTPDPGTDPIPTPTPGTDPTPTPTPGGDTGDTTGILAILTEIKDNMIQGFADIKAALVQGWADLSANFTLAIDNLSINIKNYFDKKLPDQSTPETAEPSPSPSPTPTPSPSPSPTPAPTETPTPTPSTGSKPSGDTNNFWNFVFPGSDDGTDNGHKGILWALISLLIAVVTFVLGLGSAYTYVFPFLPSGLVTTIHICVLVLLLFAIIKFVRSFL